MRIEGWENRLSEYLEAASQRDFSYGECDCVCFACDAVIQIVNIDPMLEGRGKYSTLKAGIELIEKERGSYEGIMDYYFKRLRTPRLAQRGDIVLTNIEKMPCYGVAWHSGQAMFKTKDKGLYPIPLVDCKLAWRIE